MEAFLLHEVDRELSDCGLSKYSAFIGNFVRDTILPRIDYGHYGVVDWATLPTLDVAALQHMLQSESSEVIKAICDFMEMFQKVRFSPGPY